MVISKKDFNVMAHLKAEWPLQQIILNFYFFYFTIFFSSAWRHHFGRAVARKSSI